MVASNVRAMPRVFFRSRSVGTLPLNALPRLLMAEADKKFGKCLPCVIRLIPPPLEMSANSIKFPFFSSTISTQHARGAATHLRNRCAFALLFFLISANMPEKLIMLEQNHPPHIRPYRRPVAAAGGPGPVASAVPDRLRGAHRIRGRKKRPTPMPPRPPLQRDFPDSTLPPQPSRSSTRTWPMA